MLHAAREFKRAGRSKGRSALWSCSGSSGFDQRGSILKANFIRIHNNRSCIFEKRRPEVARLQKNQELRNHEGKMVFFVFFCGLCYCVGAETSEEERKTFKVDSRWNESASSPPFTSSASTQSHKTIILQNSLQEEEFGKEH